MRAILMFHNCEGQSQYPQTTTFQVKGEQKQIRTEVPLLTSLTARPSGSRLIETELLCCLMSSDVG